MVGGGGAGERGGKEREGEGGVMGIGVIVRHVDTQAAVCIVLGAT